MLSAAERDVIFDFDPEPCVDCAWGMAYMHCHGVDGEPRCRDCVHKLAARRGWDQPPVAPTAPPLAPPKKRGDKDNPVDELPELPTLF